MKIIKKEIIFTYQTQNDKINSGIYVGYMYDSKEIVGVIYYKNDGTPLEYEYVKDNTGNVIAVIMDSSVVAKYQYDPWGNTISIYEDFNDGFARINPIS